MIDPVFSQLRNRVEAIDSKNVREAATVILEIAETNSNSALASHLEDALNKSAVGKGIATFWSGKGENGMYNKANAEALQDQGLDVYLFLDTEVGKFVDGTSEHFSKYYLDDTRVEFINLASVMMADQATGPVIACVSGDVRPDSTWFSELETLMEDNDTIVNGVPVASLNDRIPDEASETALQLAHNVVSQTYKCFDDYNEEGLVPFPYAKTQEDGRWDWSDIATAVGLGALGVGAGVAAAVTAPAWATGAATATGVGVLGLLIWDASTSPVEASDDLSQSTLDYLNNGFATTSFSAAMAQEMIYRNAHEQGTFSGLSTRDVEAMFPGVSELPITRTFMPSLEQNPVTRGGTSFDSSAYGFDISTRFSHGSQDQETQTFGSDFQSILNDGQLISGGNWRVTSKTTNTPASTFL